MHRKQEYGRPRGQTRHEASVRSSVVAGLTRVCVGFPAAADGIPIVRSWHSSTVILAVVDGATPSF